MITLEYVVGRLTRIADLMLEIMLTFASSVTCLKDTSIREVVLASNNSSSSITLKTKFQDFGGIPRRSG
jgi:hypothetical protein